MPSAPPLNSKAAWFRFDKPLWFQSFAAVPLLWWFQSLAERPRW